MAPASARYPACPLKMCDALTYPVVAILGLMFGLIHCYPMPSAVSIMRLEMPPAG